MGWRRTLTGMDSSRFPRRDHTSSSPTPRTPHPERATAVTTRARQLSESADAVLDAMERHLLASTEDSRGDLENHLARLAHETVLTAAWLRVPLRGTGTGYPMEPLFADSALRQRITTATEELRDLARLIASAPEEADVSEAIDALGSDLQVLLDRTAAAAASHGIHLRTVFDTQAATGHPDSEVA